MSHYKSDEEVYERFLGEFPPLGDDLLFRTGEPAPPERHHHTREASEIFLKAEQDLARVAVAHTFEDTRWD